MIYATEDDIKSVMTEQELDQILEGFPTAVDGAEKRALAEARDALEDLYEVDLEFAKTGDDRSQSLVGYIVDLTIFYIFQRCAPDVLPDNRVDSFDRAQERFLEFNSGERKLAGVDKTVDPSGRPIRWGSNPKYNEKTTF